MPDNVVLITGGAGFIGSAVVRHLLRETDANVVNVDKLTYAANLANLAMAEHHPRYIFRRADICQRQDIERIFAEFRPTAVMHLAAESHVDRSIDEPFAFVQTNVVGTATLLHVARGYWLGLPATGRANFRFHHVSTDEVYGSLDSTGSFTESTPYHPSSPYSASKASADHFVRAWHKTYGLPIVISNCSNNFGPYQFPEKLIPLMIINGLSGQSMPVYGKGNNIRDWLYVEDHARALRMILLNGKIGESYNVGGDSEHCNIEVVEMICDMLDEIQGPLPQCKSRRALIDFVADRPAHDVRYAIDASKIRSELGWRPGENFRSGLRRTIEWYLANRNWWAPLLPAAGTRQGLGR